MSFLGLTPVTGSPGTVVTGAVVDPGHVRAAAEGTAIPSAPGSATTPYFAAQSHAAITQTQSKLKVGYDDGTLTGQFLFAYWHNEDKQLAPDCYLRDAAGNVVCEGRVTIGTQTYTASGANFSTTIHDEYLVGLKLSAPLGKPDGGLGAPKAFSTTARPKGIAAWGLFAFVLIVLPMFTMSLIAIVLVERFILPHASRVQRWLGLA